MKILLTDDHQLIFNGLQALLAGEDAYQLVPHLVQRKQDVLPQIQHWNPDILLLDINLQGANTLEMLADIRMSFPKVKVIILSSYTENSLVEKARLGGVIAFLNKDLTFEELDFAIQNGSVGKPYIGKNIDTLNPENYLQKQEIIPDHFSMKLKLSSREIEIIRYVVAGLTTDAIAALLYLSPHTVHTHRRNILSKLELHSTPDLVKWALKQGF